MEQLFLEGVTTGRELGKDDLHYETEKYISEQILILSNYFIKDNIWSNQPPANYRDKKEIPEYNPDDSEFEGKIENVKDGKTCNEDIDNENNSDIEKPDWASKEKPFK